MLCMAAQCYILQRSLDRSGCGLVPLEQVLAQPNYAHRLPGVGYALLAAGMNDNLVTRCFEDPSGRVESSYLVW